MPKPVKCWTQEEQEMKARVSVCCGCAGGILGDLWPSRSRRQVLGERGGMGGGRFRVKGG